MNFLVEAVFDRKGGLCKVASSSEGKGNGGSGIRFGFVVQARYTLIFEGPNTANQEGISQPKGQGRHIG